jgi:hypothetical protein
MIALFKTKATREEKAAAAKLAAEETRIANLAALKAAYVRNMASYKEPTVEEQEAAMYGAFFAAQHAAAISK